MPKIIIGGVLLFIILGAVAFKNPSLNSYFSSKLPQSTNILSEKSPLPPLLPTGSPSASPVQPSEKALKIAAFAWLRMTAANKIEIKEKNGDKEADDNTAIRQWAIRMDQDPVYLAKNEALMEKIQTQESRPVYNQQAAPAQIIQQPATQQNNSLHCTSSTIGNFTNTNCY